MRRITSHSHKGAGGRVQGEGQSTTPSHWVRAPLRGIPLGFSSKVSGMEETLSEIN